MLCAHIPVAKILWRVAACASFDYVDALDSSILVLMIFWISRHKWYTSCHQASFVLNEVTDKKKDPTVTCQKHEDDLERVRTLVEPIFHTLKRSCYLAEIQENLEAKVIVYETTQGRNYVWISWHLSDVSAIVDEVVESRIVDIVADPGQRRIPIVVKPISKRR